MKMLHSRGFSLPEDISGEAQILLYFEWLADEAPPRTPRWQDRLAAFGSNPGFPVREAALRSIPEPVPAACFGFIRTKLADPDLGVRRAACAVAGRSADQEFLKPVLGIVATERHEWLLRDASNAAWSLGARFPLLEIWTNRLIEDSLLALALDNLSRVIDSRPTGYSGRTDLNQVERLDLQKHWQEFLAKHEPEIRAGKRFEIGEPALTPALFGRARTWEFSDGTSWPTPVQTNR
jgi:hypothetical protein